MEALKDAGPCLYHLAKLGLIIPKKMKPCCKAIAQNQNLFAQDMNGGECCRIMWGFLKSEFEEPEQIKELCEAFTPDKNADERLDIIKDIAESGLYSPDHIRMVVDIYRD